MGHNTVRKAAKASELIPPIAIGFSSHDPSGSLPSRFGNLNMSSNTLDRSRLRLGTLNRTLSTYAC
jgi:hypothetical protein